MNVVRLVAVLGPLVICACASTGGGDRSAVPSRPPAEATPASLETAVRALHAGMASSDPAEQERALRAILPVRGDVEFLFPKDAAALWPVFEGNERELLSHRADIAAETQHGGAVRQIETVDVRERKNPAFDRVLAMLPPDVPVYLVVTRREKATAGSGSYLYVRGRWVWIRGLQGVPDYLDKNRRSE
jgi:hypothetical protein